MEWQCAFLSSIFGCLMLFAHFRLVWPVASGVSDQPMSEEETKQGAENRAKAAAAAFAQAGESGPDFAVGLEGGVGRCGEGYHSAPF